MNTPELPQTVEPAQIRDRQATAWPYSANREVSILAAFNRGHRL